MQVTIKAQHGIQVTYARQFFLHDIANKFAESITVSLHLQLPTGIAFHATLKVSVNSDMLCVHVESFISIVAWEIC